MLSSWFQVFFYCTVFPTIAFDRIRQVFDRSRAQQLTYPKLLKRFGTMVLLTDSRVMEFQVAFLALLFPFSARDGYLFICSLL